MYYRLLVSNPKLASSSIVDVDIPGILKVSRIEIGSSFVFMWNCYRAKILGFKEKACKQQLQVVF